MKILGKPETPLADNSNFWWLIARSGEAFTGYKLKIIINNVNLENDYIKQFWELENIL